MYRSLLYQLLVKFSDLQELLDGADLDIQPTWSLRVLRRLFADAIQKLGQRGLVCFVDALDECDESQVQDMVDSFEVLGQSAVEAGINLRICFSSRHYPYIHIPCGRKITVEVQPGHADDLEKYIRSKLRVGTSKRIEDVRAKVLRKADGIFLWVVLVVSILNGEFNNGRIFAVEKRLEEIPPKLSLLFEDILTRDNKNMDDLLLCIQWILYAKQPLRREELYFAVVSGLDPDPANLAEWDPSTTSLEDMGRFVLGTSKGLAEVTRSKDPRVQFIHESVRDYLVKDGGLLHLWPKIGDDFESRSHDRLKTCCQTYLNSNISRYIPSGDALPLAKSETAKQLRQSVSIGFPFLYYATTYVLDHANVAARAVPQDNFLKGFPWQTWIRLNNLFEKHQVRRYDDLVGHLYILAERNVANLIRVWRRHDPRTLILGGRYEYPIFAALMLGHRDAARALLHQETGPAQGDDIYSQLKYAPDFTFSKGRSPIFWALESGCLATTMAWIEFEEVNVKVTNKDGQTLLLYAAEKGHDVVVKLLLSTNQVNADTKDNLGRSPLLCAAMNGHDTVVKLLLSTNQVNANTKNNIGRTPLFYAESYGYDAVVKLLLATGQVDVDI